MKGEASTFVKIIVITKRMMQSKFPPKDTGVKILGLICSDGNGSVLWRSRNSELGYLVSGIIHKRIIKGHMTYASKKRLPYNLQDHQLSKVYFL